MGIDELMLPSTNHSVGSASESRSSSSYSGEQMEALDNEASTVPVMEKNLPDDVSISSTADQEVPLKSSECTPEQQDFYFILQTEIVKGRSMEYGIASFKCLHCDYKTESRTAITAHMKSWHIELLRLNQSIETRPRLSKKCVENQKLISMSQYEATYGELRLKKKTRDSQGRIPRPLEKQDIPGIYPCSKCDKVFSRVRYLKKHALIHTNAKDYTCEKCGKGFKCQTYLTMHRKIHKEKEFKCSQCDFRSNLKTAIHEHRQLHSEGSVLCDICGYAYNDKSTLTKHKQVHDPSRPFYCTFPGCTWRFKSDAMCRAHIRGHTSEGKFKCNLCGYRFRHKHHLQRHETAMHGIQHLKSRGQHKPADTCTTIDTNLTDTISFVVNPDLTAEQFQTLSQHQLVVATDSEGTPIAVEASDINSLNNMLQYQALIQNATVAQGADVKTLDLAVSVMDSNGGTVVLM
jgi:KRAB domain-containing zinc finger protein